MSIRSSVFVAHQHIEAISYRTQWLARRGNCAYLQVSMSLAPPTRDGSPARQPLFKRDVRSLLSGEALEDDLGLAVDAQVLDRLGVRRAGRAVVTAGSVAQRRARGGSGDGLHGCGKRKKKKRRGEVSKEGRKKEI